MVYAIPRTGWDWGSVGYSHIKKITYEKEKADDSTGKLAYGDPKEISTWADTSSVRVVDGKRYCRLYEDKECIPGMPGGALVVSAVSGFLAPAYAAVRLTGIVLTSPCLGLKDSAWRFIKMIFLMIAYTFAHVLTILETLLISPEPVNGRQLVERIEQAMNPSVDGTRNLGLDEVWWIADGRQKRFPDNPLHGGFIWCGCYQSDLVGELDKDNNIVAVRTYGGKSKDRFTIVPNSCQQYEAYPWTRAIQWVIAKCSSTPAAAAPAA